MNKNRTYEQEKYMEKLLSVCLIVKDEEDVLRRCLDSLKKLADEIIVVDTGSTDSTKEIAKEYTEHVYDYVWTNDFSAARNESLRYATGKWVLVLDADEYINAEQVDEYRLYLQDEQIRPNCIYSISVVSYVGESIHNSTVTAAPIPRLFPNFQGFQYHRPIHEQLKNQDVGSSLYSVASPITVFHTGYLKEVLTSKNKSDRNQKIFTALKQKSGFTPYDHFTVGNEHAMKGDYKKAIYNYERALSKATIENPWRWHCAFDLASLYSKNDRLSEALDIINRFFKEQNQYPEYHCLMGQLYEIAGMTTYAKQSYSNAFQAAEQLSEKQSTFWLVNPAYGSTIPLLKLVHYSELDQDTENVVFYSVKLLQSNPYEYKALVRLLEITTSYESNEAVLQLIDKLFPENKQHDILMLFKIFVSIGHAELAEHFYLKIDNKDTISHLEKLRYSILQDNRTAFQESLEYISKPLRKQEELLFVHIGSLIFNLDHQMTYEKVEESLHKQLDCYSNLSKDNLDDSWIEKNSLILFDFLAELVVLKQYDQFDQFISKLNHPAIINLTANYFYSRRMTDIAIDYYNMLLDAGVLNQAGLVNFAKLHFKNNLIEQGCQMLVEALEIEPNIRHVHTLLLDHCTDMAHKKQYKEKYFTLSPQLSKLPGAESL